MPKKHKHLFHTLFFLVALFSLASADFEDLVTNVYSVSTDPNAVGSSWRRASLEGGSYLYIKGAGFSSRSASSNRVTIDDTICPVIEFLTTSTQVVCQVPPSATEKTATVRVFVDNLRVGTCGSCTITYTSSATPHLYSMIPNAANPGDEIYFFGNQRVSNSLNVDYVKIGDYRCDASEQNEFNSLTFSGLSQSPCNVPYNIEAGYYSVSQRNLQSTGNARKMATLPTYRFNGNPYDFAVAPKISRISSNVGSPEGQIITISGSGFSSTEQNEVNLADTPCTILEQSSHQIKCELQSRSTPFTERAYHAGLKYEVYSRKDINAVKGGTAGTPSSVSTRLVPEIPQNLATDYTSKFSGYFKAPTTGNYKFLVASDDKAQIYISTTPLDKSNLQLIVDSQYYTNYRFFFTKGYNQISNDIALTADNYYYIELYHQQAGGSDSATFGVQIPGAPNTVNPTTEVQSIKLNCPTIYEILEFRLSGVTGGQFRIRFDTLSADGKKISSTSRTGNMTHITTVSNIASQISSAAGITTQATIEMQTENGTTTVNATEATTIIYQVTFQGLRKNGMLPVIENVNLIGSKITTKVTQLQEPSPAIGGSFTVTYGGNTVEISPYASANSLASSLIGLGYKEPIRATISGNTEFGAEWRVHFVGDGAGPVAQLSVGNSLTGCSDPSQITIDVNTIQDSSQDLFYEVIPMELLFTAETVPQITVTSNGILGTCPSFNCDYEILNTGIPELATASYSGTTLSLSLINVNTGDYIDSDISVTFGNDECQITNYDDGSSPATITATCSNPEAGDHIPKVHFNDLGYAQTDSAVSAIPISLSVSSVSPTSVNPNGGSVLTVSGSGFPLNLELAQKRGITLEIGSSTCAPTAVSPTSITCKSTSVISAAALNIGLNGKTASSSTLSILSTVPSISSLSPVSANPVLQTDITITGTDFDSTSAQTKVYLSNTVTSKIVECLVSSSITTEVKCKLLGAPTGTYNLYVQTSLGYSTSRTFTVQTAINSVSPTSGSVVGGTLLTITGGTFSDQITQTQVFIGADSIPCQVVTSTPTQVTCITGSLKDLGQAGTASTVYVDTRIVESAVCQGTCSFTYDNSLTPQITALDTTTVTAGGSLQITGSGLASNPAGTDPSVTIGGVSCSITSASANQIVVAVPSAITPSTAAELVVNVAGKGNAQFDAALNSTVAVTPTITAISPIDGSNAGVLLTITGTGFKEGASVKVGTTACEIRSLTSTSVTCKATSSGEVSLTYDTFTNVKCSTACTLTRTTANTPTVSSVTPLSPSTSSFTLTVLGTKLNLGTASVVLVSTTDKSVRFTGSTSTISAGEVSASFADVAAGTYSVEVASGANLASFASTVNVPLSASVSSAVESSLAGGVTLSITGSGFFGSTESDKNKVSVCGFPCKVTQSTSTSISCETPLFVNAAVKSTYPDIVSPSLLKPAKTSSDSGKESTVFDLAFTTSYTTSTTSCYIGFDIGENLLAELSEIMYFPNPAITSSTLKGTIIEGSNDGTTYTLISTLDASVHDGWNTIRFDTTNVRYRHYRLSGGSSTAKCALSELQFHGIVLSNSAATNLDAISCGAVVNVNDKSQQIASAVNYKQSNTGTLSTVSPNMGTTAGSTTITLDGSNFDTTNVEVFIDDIACNVQTVSLTRITCITGMAPPISSRKSSLQSTLTIKTSKGLAITNGLKYFYIDRWSDVNTWGGITPPREGDSVSIPAGQIVLLDISPPKLKAIIIEGALVFEDTNIDLNCEYIMISEGRLQIGTKEQPIQSKITVTMHGTKELAHLPTFGNKVIALMGGILDIHGKERSHTWTSLQSTAEIGQSSIIVQGDVDWAAGEEIVIASTDHDHYNSESRTITSAFKETPVTGQTTLYFAEPLKHRHYATIYTTPDGVTFEMRAEVGLLTRNVVIQGDETSQKNQYGCHIMAHSSTGDDSSIGRISYTEVRQAGQAFNLGRYPIHFHLIGNVRQSYVLGNSIHHTYNRAVTIHGVHNLKVQKNVAYWVMGHTIFIEDGIETHNLIEDNLVINTIASTALLNTDQTPASFWITNPNNIWRRNHAAGSDRYGFWFDLREHPEGPSATPSICPVGEKLGEFTDNQAHSNGRYGLRIFHELIPRTYPCQPITPYENNEPIPAEFTNFLGWKNVRSAIIGERMGAIKFKNIKAADNRRAGIEISDGDWSPSYTLQVEDAWIVGRTLEAGSYDYYLFNQGARGLITPKKEFFIARRVNFYNFGSGMTAIETCSHCEHPAASTEGAITSYVEQLKFDNVTQRVRFNVPEKEIIVDNDGTLTGSGKKGVVTKFYSHLNIPGCVRNEDVFHGLVCDETVTVRKIEFSNLDPFGSFNMQDLVAFNIENENVDSNPGFIPFRRQKSNWAVPFVTGYSYRISWKSRADFNGLKIGPSKVFEANDKGVSIVFNHSDFRETFDLIGMKANTNISNQTALWTTQNTHTKNCGDWYHDVPNQFLYVAVSPIQMQIIDVSAVKCRLNCPVPAVNIPKDGVIRLWSNVTQWPNNRLPLAGEDVVVPGDWTLKLDISPPSLGFLHIKGDFYFDESKEELVLTAQRIWVEGQLFIGNNTDERYVNKAKIVLTGDRRSTNLVIGPIQDVSNKVLAVTGNATMYGNLVNNVYVRLEAPVQIGDTIIKVPSTVDWVVGDEIFIAPSQTNFAEYETRTIVAINNGEITLNSSLQFYHFGAATTTKTTSVGTIDMRAEVGLLTRNIKIEGTDEDHWGARLYVGEIYEPTVDYYYRGRVDLDGVEMKNVGQANTTLAGLTFDRLSTGNNDISTVRRTVIRDSQGVSFRVIGSIGITVENNVFYKSYRWQIKFEGINNDIIFKNNLAVANRERGLSADKGDNSVDFLSLFYAEEIFARSEISGNIFAGCEMTCIVSRGGSCSTQAEGPWTFFDNIAHSGETGWLVSEPDAVCNGISHYTGHHLTEGIATFFRNKNIKASNLIITDTHIGVSLNLGGAFDEASIDLRNSYFAGVASDPSSYINKQECSHNAGIYISVATIGPKSIPPTKSQLPWYKIKSEHIWKSTFTVSGVTFENFKDNQVPGCVGNYIFKSNPYASDASSSTKVSGVTLVNVGQENIVLFNQATNDWIGVDNCGGWFCTGIKNLIIRDVDGSLTGQASTLIPQNSGVFDANTCTSSASQNAYICREKGWGVLVFESQDVDYNTRIISPINITTKDGFQNDLNTYMDHGWDGFYTSLKRMSRFNGVVQAARDYIIHFTGTLPNVMRWSLQGANSNDAITAQFGYTQPQSVRITNKTGHIVKQTIFQTNVPYSIQSTDACGTNIYSIDDRKVTIKLTGDDSCELKTTVINSIQASVRYDMTVEEFFAKDGPTQFIDRIAAILNINPASIRIVEVRKGSVIVRAFFDADAQGSDPQNTIDANKQMREWSEKLTKAAKNGDLMILNARILDSSFDIVLSNPEHFKSSMSKTSKIVIIVAAVVAFIALAIGAYFAYGRYFKKRVIPVSATPAAKMSKFQESYINTENPLVGGTSRLEGLSQNNSPDLRSSISVNFQDNNSPYKPAIHLNYEVDSPEKPHSAFRNY